MELFEITNGRRQRFRIAAHTAQEAARVLRRSGDLRGSPRGVRVVTEQGRSLAEGLDGILASGRPGHLCRLQAVGEDGRISGSLRWACVSPLDLRPRPGAVPERSFLRALEALFEAVDTLLGLLQKVEARLA
jgi:hypothetical protein